MIASGLRAFYTLEEMQGRRVIVLANLKARNIGGFKSNGMVSEAYIHPVHWHIHTLLMGLPQ